MTVFQQGTTSHSLYFKCCINGSLRGGDIFFKNPPTHRDYCMMSLQVICRLCKKIWAVWKDFVCVSFLNIMNKLRTSNTFTRTFMFLQPARHYCGIKVINKFTMGVTMLFSLNIITVNS